MGYFSWSSCTSHCFLCGQSPVLLFWEQLCPLLLPHFRLWS
jgi:hypothetical protein